MSEVRADQTQKSTPAPLYMADAPQTFKFNFQGKGRFSGCFYPVLITFSPMKPGDYIAYDQQRDVRMAGATDGVNASNQTHGASVWLGKKLLANVEGWDRNSKGFDERLADAVQSGLLACDIEPRPAPIQGDAAKDCPWEDDDAAAAPIRLRCIAEGQLITTEHTPGQLDEQTLERLRKRYNRLKSQAKLVEGEQIGRRETKVPSRAEEKGKLYDELGFSATGYDGRVPPHHKEMVVDDFFSVEQELVEGKSLDSSPQ
jgi:hypothetical protein